MKSLTLLSALLAAALSTTVAYACPPAKADHCDPKSHGAPMGSLKDELKLTPEQEATWKAMQDHNRARMERHSKDADEAMEKSSGLTAPQRMEQQEAMRKHHEQDRAEGMAEFKAFYEKLNPEQQKTLDNHFGRMEHMGAMHDGCEPKRLPTMKN